MAYLRQIPDGQFLRIIRANIVKGKRNLGNTPNVI